MGTSISIEDKRNTRLYISVITVMFIIDKLVGVELPEFMYTLIIAVFFMFSSFETIIYMLCYTFPLSFLFSSIAHIWAVTLVLLMIKSAWKADASRKTFKIQKRRSLIILLFFLLEINAHRIYGVSDVNRMGGYLLTVAILFYLLYDKRAELNYSYCLEQYIYGTFVLCMLFIVNAMVNAPSNWIALMAMGMLRFGGTVNSKFGTMTVNLNANTMAYFSIVGIACSLVMIRDFRGMSSLKRIFFVLQLALISVIGMLTVSRSWLLSLVIILVLFFFSQMKTPRTLINVLVGALVVFLFVLMFFFQGNSTILSAFVARFTNGDIATGAGRSDIFKDYMNIFASNSSFVFFGTGVTDYVEVTNMWQSLHNGLQQILICLGVPGASSFLIVLLRPVLNKTNRRVSLLYWLPFLSVVIFTQTIQFLNPNLIMLPYIIGLYGIRKGLQDISNTREL